MSEKTIRREDALLLTGKGRYTADWNLPGQLHAFFLRSDRAHADIVSIDAKAARARPGVHAVLAGADYAASGWKSLPGGVAYEGVGGQKQKKPFWPALAQGRVHYVGQPVALVVADSAALAHAECTVLGAGAREQAFFCFCPRTPSSATAPGSG